MLWSKQYNTFEFFTFKFSDLIVVLLQVCGSCSQSAMFLFVVIGCPFASSCFSMFWYLRVMQAKAEVQN